MIFHSMQTDHFKKLMSMAEGNRIEGESMDCSTYCVPDSSLGSEALFIFIRQRCTSFEIAHNSYERVYECLV